MLATLSNLLKEQRTAATTAVAIFIYHIHYIKQDEAMSILEDNMIPVLGHEITVPSTPSVTIEVNYKLMF